MGCEFKTSCNGEIGALQEFCAGSGERSGAAAGSTTSRAVASMGKEEFEASCKAVIEIVSSMARTTPTELKKNAGKAA